MGRRRWVESEVPKSKVPSYRDNLRRRAEERAFVGVAEGVLEENDAFPWNYQHRCHVGRQNPREFLEGEIDRLGLKAEYEARLVAERSRLNRLKWTV